MHLLNATTLEVHQFIGNIPAYVILLHTWEDEGVTFDDIDMPHAKVMAGYGKIKKCCEQAKRDGFRWTLQELPAPAIVEFYDKDWTFIGSKSGLARDIELSTRIQARYLFDRRIIRYASIELRFSWASQRETTREEDIAYCLLGLVGVNMPLLYGEGTRAFYRLQLDCSNTRPIILCSHGQ
jgi:hypothetical protein